MGLICKTRIEVNFWMRQVSIANTKESLRKTVHVYGPASIFVSATTQQAKGVADYRTCGLSVLIPYIGAIVMVLPEGALKDECNTPTYLPSNPEAKVIVPAPSSTVIPIIALEEVTPDH